MRKIFIFIVLFSIAFGSLGNEVVWARPRCVLGDPILNIWFYSTPLSPGQSGSIMTKIGNGDSDVCRDSEFKLSVNMPHAWRPALDPLGDITVAATGNSNLFERQKIDFTVPANTEARPYPFIVTLKNKRTHRSVTQTVQIQVGNTPVITNMTPSSGPVGTHIVLTGTNFGTLPELAFQNNSDGFFYVRGVPSNGSTFSFDAPAMISKYSCGCNGSTTPGLYNVSIGNNGTYSNIMNFNVTQL